MSRRSSQLIQPFYTSEYDLFLILKELYISTFRWNGLPNTVNTRFLEEQLFEQGRVFLLEDDVIGVVGLGGALIGLDIYGEPIGLRAVAPTGYNKYVKNNKGGVVIYDNNTKRTVIPRLRWYAQRIYNLERTIDLNVIAQKTPFVIQLENETQKLTFINLWKQIDNYDPLVIVDKGIKIDENFKLLKLEAPFVGDKLEELKRKLWNEALSFIGIENNFSEKSERLTQGEVMISNGLSIAHKNARLLSRERGIEKYNLIFGKRYGIAEPEIVNVMVTQMEGGVDDGEVHDNS